MNSAKSGRPPKGAEATNPGKILDAALDLLRVSGADALSMRALGRKLGINPMTIYHHVGDRQALIRALAERVYGTLSGFGPISENSPLNDIERFLGSYHRAVLSCPQLTLVIFSEPDAFPDQAKTITQVLRSRLALVCGDADATERWLDILIDYTHGHALALALHASATGSEDGLPESSSRFLASLSSLLDAMQLQCRFREDRNV